jgi:hypothetical protein
MPKNVGGDDRLTNCGMCTMAGLLDVTSADIARLVGAVGQSDDALARAWKIGGLDAEPLFAKASDKLFRFVYIELKKCRVSYDFAYRSATGYGGLWPADQLHRWMLGFRVGTRFAVWGCEDGLIGEGAHWNCAKLTENGVQFVDYQYNYDNKDAAVSDSFIPPCESGSEPDDYVKFQGFAFSRDKQQ